MQEINKISILGAGNVAFHLGKAFAEAGKKVVQVYSRSESSASALADSLHAPYCTGISEVLPGSDLYLLAVSDDAIKEVAGKLTLTNELVVHTSGSRSLGVLKGVSSNTGVFYPLQTFSKNRQADFRKIPVCIEANTGNNAGMLYRLARAVTGKVYFFDSETRKALHLSAVFACNFTNYLYSVAESLLAEHDIPFEILVPLIEETAAKAAEHAPSSVQTGPAMRRDKRIIDEHLRMLEGDPSLSELYRKISEMIIKKHHVNGEL